ncbi:MAG TPA: 3-phosphoshikimate 1-carboxyvinyltransferase [Tepidanaerobacteraceae bacterium]|jgi:3-phosphoshikimate 1-carboxyvinyltransferase|nr:3-phosphoshikimate 1-carboxyvinyltransferase [Tepidanaerobacteraceae bacterium]
MITRVVKNSVRGEITVPSSKSHTIRAVTIATLAKGKSIINNPLPSEDCKAALKAAEKFGAKCEVYEDKWIVEGLGSEIQVPDDVIDVKNSGTTLYFMASVAALLTDYTVFTGDKSIRSRPITPLLNALEQLGATSHKTRAKIDAPPFIVKGPIHSGTVRVIGSPSQYISSLLLVSPMLEGKTRIETENPKETPYIDMTIDWMKSTGIELTYDKDEYKYYEVSGKQEYIPFTRTMPSDWSSVAFPLAAALTPGSNLIINSLDFNDKQGDAKIVEYLQNMGADIKIDRANGRLIINGGKELTGITIDCANTPDAVPILSVVGCTAKGITVLDNVAGARLKETDRVSVMEEVLSKMGARIETEHNKITIYGETPLKGAVLESYHDHRVAMALSVAGLFAEGETVIKNSECVNATFPRFFEIMNKLGAGFETE